MYVRYWHLSGEQGKVRKLTERLAYISNDTEQLHSLVYPINLTHSPTLNI